MTEYGIDVSHWQDPFDYGPILSKKAFAFTKASEGVTRDIEFEFHRDYFRTYGVPIIGAYHFGRNDVRAADQLAFFLSRAKGVTAYALDVEGANAMTATQGRYFIDGMHDHDLGIGMYHSESGFPDWGQDYDWVANYSREPSRHYDIWQYGPAAVNVDGDLTRLTLPQLHALLEGTMPDIDLTRFPEDAPRRFRSKPGLTRLQTFIRTARAADIDAPYAGYVDREVTILATTGPHGSGFVRLSSGGAAGRYVLAAEIDVVPPPPPEPPVPDPAVIKAAVNLALDHVAPVAGALTKAIDEARLR